jgi:predicted transcriptional regulator of viral defense system
MTTTKVSRVLRLARRGPIRARDLDAAEIPRAYLRRLVERGVLEQAGRGLYRLTSADATELRSVADVAAHAPEGIICLLSALQLHGLTTELPHAVWLMIDTRARAPKIETPAVEIVRAHGRARSHGVETRRIEGVPVKLTSPAKTVADCFRYRRHVGLEVAIAALRDYVSKKAGSVDALVAAARADRAYSIVRPYLEALV